MHLDRARARANRYLGRHGTRATISRKEGSAWAVKATDVPVMVEALQSGRDIPIDALETARDGAAVYRLSFLPGEIVKAGDRVAADSTPEVLTLTTVADTSLDVYRQAVAVAERTAVETYPLTFERWSDAEGGYTEVLSVEAQVSAATPGADGTITGTVTITPPPAVALGAGDDIIGIPWAPGARVARVRPVVGDRVELDYVATAGPA